MKKGLMLLVLVGALCLGGCKGLMVGYNSMAYDHPQFSITMSKVDDVTTDTLHLRGTFQSKAGQKTPDVRAALTDYGQGGKQLDVYVKTSD